MKARKLMLVAVCIGASAGPGGRLAAVEFDLLTNDSYLSPAVVASARGDKARPPAFVWVSAAVAAENHYLVRNDNANVASAVGILTGDCYFDNWQFGGSAEHRSRLDGDGDPGAGLIPREHYRLYVGYYLPLHLDAAARKWVDGKDLRLLGGWSGDRQSDGRWVDEAFVELSIKLNLLPRKLAEHTAFAKDVTGGYVYAWRRAGTEHFAGYSLKATLRRKKHGVNLRYLLTFGAERKAGNTHWAEIQNGLVLWYEHPRTKLRYELGVATSRDVYRDEWNDQVMFAIKRDLVTRIIRR